MAEHLVPSWRFSVLFGAHCLLLCGFCPPSSWPERLLFPSAHMLVPCELCAFPMEHFQICFSPQHLFCFAPGLSLYLYAVDKPHFPLWR